MPADRYPHRDSLRRFAESVASSSPDLARAGHRSLDGLPADLPAEVILELRQLVLAGFVEADVIREFVTALAAQFRTGGIARRVLGTLQRLKGCGTDAGKTELGRHVESLVTRLVNAREVDTGAQVMPACLDA